MLGRSVEPALRFIHSRVAHTMPRTAAADVLGSKMAGRAMLRWAAVARNQSRARQTRRAPVEQKQRPRNRDDCVVPGAGLRDDIIAGPIIMPIYVYLPLKQETFLDLGVIMLGAGSTRFHAEQSGTLAGGRVDAQHLQLYARRDIEPYAFRSATRHRGSAANTTLNR